MKSAKVLFFIAVLFFITTLPFYATAHFLEGDSIHTSDDHFVEGDDDESPPPPGDGNNPVSITITNPLQAEDICGVLKAIVDFLVLVGAPVATAMILYGAYQILFAQGKTEKLMEGKNTILWTFVGYGLILIGWGFVFVINDVLGGAITPICGA